MPEILIRITTPNKEHRHPCWCRECRGMPGTIAVEWRARPTISPPKVADDVEFRGEVTIHDPPVPGSIGLRRAVEEAYSSALAAIQRTRRWQIGDRVRLNPKAPRTCELREPEASEVGTVTKLLPDGRPCVLWPTWPKHLASEPPPYLDGDLILVFGTNSVEDPPPPVQSPAIPG